MAFLEDIRQGLIDDGHASKLLLDYLDDRMEQLITDKLMHVQEDIETHMREDIENINRRLRG